MATNTQTTTTTTTAAAAAAPKGVTLAWVALRRGKQGDIVAFHQRQLVVFPHGSLPFGAKEGDWAQISAQPAKSGRCLIGSIRQSARAGVPVVVRQPSEDGWKAACEEARQVKGRHVPTFTEYVVRLWLRHEDNCSAQREQEAQAREAKAQAEAQAREELEAQAGKRGAAFIEGVRRFDPLAGGQEDLAEQLRALWAKLTDRQQLEVLSHGELDSRMVVLFG